MACAEYASRQNMLHRPILRAAGSRSDTTSPLRHVPTRDEASNQSIGRVISSTLGVASVIGGIWIVLICHRLRTDDFRQRPKCRSRVPACLSGLLDEIDNERLERLLAREIVHEIVGLQCGWCDFYETSCSTAEPGSFKMVPGLEVWLLQRGIVTIRDMRRRSLDSRQWYRADALMEIRRRRGVYRSATKLRRPRCVADCGWDDPGSCIKIETFIEAGRETYALFTGYSPMPGSAAR